MAKRLIQVLWAVTLFTAFTACALAQEDSPGSLNPVKWSAKPVATKPIKIGEQFGIQLIAEIEEGWHLYSIEEMPNVEVELKAEKWVRKFGFERYFPVIGHWRIFLSRKSKIFWPIRLAHNLERKRREVLDADNC